MDADVRRPALLEFRGPIVVGYDGSDTARRALARAAAAAGAGGHVVVVTVRPPVYGRRADPDSDAIERTSGALLEEAEHLLREQGVVASTRALQGDPAEALVETARETAAALIVVGARGRSYLERALRGSVAEKLGSRAPCDLLVVR